MTDLLPNSAFGGRTPRRETFGALTISENVDLALASLAVLRDRSAPQPFGMTLPSAGTATFSGDAVALWIGSNQWLIGRAETEAADFAAAVKQEAPGCAVTEQTDGFVVLDIVSNTGADLIAALMSKLVNLDPTLLCPGCATRTGLKHMTVFLVRRADDHLTVMGLRSLAEALWRELSIAAKRLDT
ncbi:sarcosine oxidase subunit gamma [Marivita sp. S2033]|uniref:sarcosine oxidase subunit gamma n=1 Tax=Marivita sp. S2033 TaxID=3373187 RepID=UPI0039820AF2